MSGAVTFVECESCGEDVPDFEAQVCDDCDALLCDDCYTSTTHGCAVTE